MVWHNGGKGNLWLCLGFLTLITLVCTDGVNADGPIRRWLRGGQPTRSTVTRAGYVCEGGVCSPIVSSTAYTYATTSPITQMATTVQPVVAGARPVELSIVEVEGGKFHKAVIQAAIKAQKAGTISRVELVKLRVAMLAPSFRQRAEDLALIQVAASDDDGEPIFTIGEDGTIDRTAIDWDSFASFLERLVPIILSLLKAFGI